MPLPTHLLFTFASGVLVALIARAELRGSPSAATATTAFQAYLAYVGLVVVPGSLFLYLFYGDWYLLYLVDTQRVPSALVVLGAALQLGVGTGGFMFAATCIRRQREPWAGAVAGIALSIAIALVPIVRERLSVIGSYMQFRGDFGLAPFGGELLFAVVSITFFTLLGLGVIVHQLGAARRSA